MICSSLILINETESLISPFPGNLEIFEKSGPRSRAAGSGPKLFDLAASWLDSGWNVRAELAIFAPESS
jgi:hypothetical protein